MSVTSLGFLGFVSIVALLFNLRPSLWWRLVVFSIANLAFLATYWQGATGYVAMLSFVLVGWASVRLVQSGVGRPIFFWLALPTVIALFFWLKQYAFFAFVPFLKPVYLTIGLSYIFFRVVHMLIDARDGTLPHRPNLLVYLNYIFNFTTLVSGPIQRYQDFAAQMLTAQPRPLTIVDIGVAVERIILGFFKVSVVAVPLLAGHEAALSAMEGAGLLDRVVMAVAAVASYTIYLYFNFSGYTDIVIGVAGMLRLELPENFNRPFSATSFLDFWSRWHMTLSGWFRTYVYNPLLVVMMRRYPAHKVEPFLGVVAFFVTFFLVGLWHGQSSEFVVLGLMFGFGVSLNKLYQIWLVKTKGRKRYKEIVAGRVYCAVARGLTFTWLTASLFPFWTDWKGIASYLASLGVSGALLSAILLLAGSSALLALVEMARLLALRLRWGETSVLTSRYVRTVWSSAQAALIAAATVVVAGPSPEVVYKIF